MKKCPYCGSIVGLFSKETVKFDQYYKFTGEVNGYGDPVRVIKRNGTPLYCLTCKKRVTTLEELKEN